MHFELKAKAESHGLFALGFCAVIQADTQEMPNVDDYIAQKATVYRLQQEMTNWERKVNSHTLGSRFIS